MELPEHMRFQMADDYSKEPEVQRQKLRERKAELALGNRKQRRALDAKARRVKQGGQ